MAHDTVRFVGKNLPSGKCEKCGVKVRRHEWVDIDQQGRVARCSISEGVQKKP